MNIRKLYRQADSGRRTRWMKDAYIIQRQPIWNYKNSPPSFSNRLFDFGFCHSFSTFLRLALFSARYMHPTSRKMTTIPDDSPWFVTMMDNSLGNKYGRKFNSTKRLKKRSSLFRILHRSPEYATVSFSIVVYKLPATKKKQEIKPYVELNTASLLCQLLTQV